MPNQRVKNGLKAKKIKLPQKNLFLGKQLSKIYNVARFKKLQGYAIFGPKMTYLP